MEEILLSLTFGGMHLLRLTAISRHSSCPLELNMNRNWSPNIISKLKVFHHYLRYQKMDRPNVGPLRINNEIVEDTPTYPFPH